MMRLAAMALACTFILLIPGFCMSHDEVTELEVIEEIDVDPESFGYFGENIPQVDRAITLLTAKSVRKKTLLFVVDHRNRQAINDEPFHDFLGFDSGGLKIALGLRYGLYDNLDIGIYRLNGTIEPFDAYDFDARYQILQQEKHGVDLAIRPGLTWFSQEESGDAAGGFVQVLASRTFKDRMLMGVGLMYHSDSSNDVKSELDDDYSFGVQALFDYRILPRLSWNIEMAANISGYGSAHPQISSAIKFLTHRHTFAIVLSNTQYISADGVATNSDRGFDDMLIGFSITRELPL